MTTLYYLPKLHYFKLLNEISLNIDQLSLEYDQRDSHVGDLYISFTFTAYVCPLFHSLEILVRIDIRCTLMAAADL